MLAQSGIDRKQQGIRYDLSHVVKMMNTQKVVIINMKVKDDRKI